MKNISELQTPIEILFTDIDDTMTDHGQLGAESYAALWKLKKHNIHVVPVTGRPAGWCEMIARLWPVSGVVGENGGFYFRYHNQKMKRHFYFDQQTQNKNRQKLIDVEKQILKEIPNCAVSSDQFCRLMDLAIDFCEDIPKLSQSEVKKIVEIFERNGAQAKISSIHVNGWFGDYNKLAMTLEFLKREFNIDADRAKKTCAFSGDSPNDEPMFEYFPNSIGVANIIDFKDLLKYPPKYVTKTKGGSGFSEIANQLCIHAKKS